MKTAARSHIRVLLAGALLAGVAGVVPSASAHGTCSVSATVTQAAPRLKKPNPNVSYAATATCSVYHYMALTTYLGLDCPTLSVTWACDVSVDREDPPYFPYALTVSSHETITPKACPVVPTSVTGKTHHWNVEAYLYVEDANNQNWHNAIGYATLYFRCPGILG